MLWMVLLPPVIVGLTLGMLLMLAAYEAWCFSRFGPASNDK